MKILAIVNNLRISSSPASNIEKELLSGISCENGEVIAICSSLGLSEVPSNIRVVSVHESKLIIYLFALIRKVFPDITWLPDFYYASWGWLAYRKARRIVRKEKIDIIHSFGFPNTDHIIAMKIKKEFGIPWIATFFDSWTDYPTRKFKTKYFRKQDQALERNVVATADLIIHTNQSIVNIWSKRYGTEISKKLHVVPINVDFSKESNSELDTSNKEVLNITHVGTFYPYRNASDFIKALSFCFNQNPGIRNKIKVNFVGTVINSDRKLIEDLCLSDVFNLTGRITPQECQEYYRKADVLLTTAGGEGENVMFPSKIVKYFYYNRPILCLSPHNTIVEMEIKASGHCSFIPDDYNGIKTYLETAVSEYRKLCGYNQGYWKRFSKESVIDNYCTLYKTLYDEKN